MAVQFPTPGSDRDPGSRQTWSVAIAHLPTTLQQDLPVSPLEHRAGVAEGKGCVRVSLSVPPF